MKTLFCLVVLSIALSYASELPNMVGCWKQQPNTCVTVNQTLSPTSTQVGLKNQRFILFPQLLGVWTNILHAEVWVFDQPSMSCVAPLLTIDWFTSVVDQGVDVLLDNPPNLRVEYVAWNLSDVISHEVQTLNSADLVNSYNFLATVVFPDGSHLCTFQSTWVIGIPQDVTNVGPACPIFKRCALNDLLAVELIGGIPKLTVSHISPPCDPTLRSQQLAPWRLNKMDHDYQCLYN